MPPLLRPLLARLLRLCLALPPLLLAGCGGSDDDPGPALVSPRMQGLVVAFGASMSAVDPGINPRYGAFRAYLPVAGATRNELFVFLPASPATPDIYRLVAQYAAVAGLYSIGLPYVNARVVNAACTGSADADCHGHVRQAMWVGGDVPQAVPALSISSSDSIAYRLARTLAYLHTSDPTAGWGQFLDSGGNVLWNRVRLGGHGEGGVQAGYIATQTAVVQACMLSAPGDVAAGAPAPWITAAATSSATPASRFTGLAHVRDSTTAFATLQAAWNTLGLAGTATSVDGAAPPYGNSHQLTTNLPLGWSPDFHAITAIDFAVPLKADGTAAYAEAWTAACF